MTTLVTIKLCAKFDLTECKDQTKAQQQAVWDCTMKHINIFAVEDKELRQTDLLKHMIKLDHYFHTQTMKHTKKIH